MKFLLIAAMVSMTACSTHQHCDNQGKCEDDEIVSNSAIYGGGSPARETTKSDTDADGADGDSGQ